MAYLATIAPFGFDDFHPPTLLTIYRRLGCKRCQFYRNTDKPPVLKDARKIVDDLGMPFDSIHGVFGKTIDPSNPDENERRKAVDIYKAEAEVALQLGGPLVVVHPAPMADRDERITEASRKERIDPMRRSIAELAAIGERLGVVYLIENIPGNYRFGSDPIQIGSLVREIRHPNIRMCFDTGHAHMTSGVIRAIEACADVIAYLHINDNDSRTDSHLIPGHGSITWHELSERIDRLPNNIPAMLELFYSEQDLDDEIDLGLADKLHNWLAISA